MKNTILVGPMGAGKSTIGRLLAKELRLPFKDSDKEIEQRTGASIPLIFDVEGEGGFRERERAVIVDLCQLEGVVLATGGGAVLREDNRQALRAGGQVVYLCTSSTSSSNAPPATATGRYCRLVIPAAFCPPSWPFAIRYIAR